MVQQNLLVSLRHIVFWNISCWHPLHTGQDPKLITIRKHLRDQFVYKKQSGQMQWQLEFNNNYLLLELLVHLPFKLNKKDNQVVLPSLFLRRWKFWKYKKL